MSQEELEIYKRALAREKQARKQAETILEEKSAELYVVNQKLENSNNELERLYSKTNSQLQGVFENIVDAYVIMDLFGNILKMNNAAVKLLGFKSVNDNENLINLVESSHKDLVQPAFTKLLEKGNITDFEIVIQTKDGEIKFVHINASVIIENDIPVAAQGIVRDITKEKQAQERLIESENRLSSLIKNLDSGVLLEDQNRKIVLTNNKFCDFFEIPVEPEFLVGQDCSKSAEQNKTLFKDSEGFVNRINEIVKNKTLVLGDELKMVNGTILERDYIPIFQENEYQGHLWSYKDVTLQRQYRKSIESQRQKYSSIIANMNLGLVEVNNDDEILMVNHSFEELSGYTEEELLGKKGGELFQIETSEDIIVEEKQKRLKGESNSYELKVKNKDGEIRYWLISGAPNYNLNGEVIGSIGIHLDITELKSLEIQKEKLLESLAKSNKELQEYAHIVSHDLKSPLRSINALVSWIKEDNKDSLNETTIQHISLIESTLEKMETLINGILDYSSLESTTSEKEPVNLSELVSGIIEMIFIPEHFKISVLNKLPIINGDKIKLQQLFQNLISNAIKYNDKAKGFVEIDVQDLGSFYQFSIKDNGIGIEEKYHQRIFKIFHSLNQSKDSTGIGLSIVNKIVKLHDGEVWLESTPQIGTTFYFTLKK